MNQTKISEKEHVKREVVADMSHYDPAILPKVSVLVLAKNSELALKQTLTSILNQEYSDYEIFIACSDYQPKTREWIMPEKKGVLIRSFSFGNISDSHLLDTALTHLRGVYVQILFSGFVYLSPHTLRDCMQTALQQQFPSLIFTAKLKESKLKFPTLSYHPFSLETLKQGQTPTELACCFTRRDLFKQMGGWVPQNKDDYAWNFFNKLTKLEGLHTCGIKRVFIAKQPTAIERVVHRSFLKEKWYRCKRIFQAFGLVQMLRYLWG